MADKIYAVTVASGNLYGGGTGNVYYLDGVRNSVGPGTIEWTSGQTIRFDQSDGTNDNHPLFFATQASSPQSNVSSTGVTYYLDGASNQANYTNTTTFNAATTRYVEIDLSSYTRSSNLFYACWVHGIGMGGIMEEAANTNYVTTVATGSRYGGGTGNVYYLDGVRDMNLEVLGGLTYKFQQNDSTNNNHPLIFSTTTSTSQIISSGVVYKLDGVTVSQADYTNTITFNAATNRSISINVTQTSDFYYFCYVHGSGMGGVMDLQTDSWSALNWGDGAWNAQDDSTLQVTGQPMTIAQGDAEAFLREGWGTTNWGNGEWGDVTDSGGAFTGIAMSATLGSVTIDSQINTGWGRFGWNEASWGTFGTANPTGIQASMTTGSVTITSQINSGWGRAEWATKVGVLTKQK